MSEAELVEQLADAMHRSWAAYVDYLLQRGMQENGTVVIEAEYAAALQRQVQTPYAELSEHEKQLDREEASPLLRIFTAYLAQSGLAEAIERAKRHMDRSQGNDRD